MKLTTHNRPHEDERLSWPCWPDTADDLPKFTRINGYPSAAGPVQTSEIHRSETDVLPLSHPTNQWSQLVVISVACDTAAVS